MSYVNGVDFFKYLHNLNLKVDTLATEMFDISVIKITHANKHLSTVLNCRIAISGFLALYVCTVLTECVN